MFERILVPTDGSNYSFKAGQKAVDFARKYSSKVIVTHIINQESTVSYTELEDAAREYIQKIIDYALEKGVECESMIIYGSPEFDIMTLTRKSEADSIMISTHGKDNSIKTMGSFTENIIEKIDLPIILVK